MDKFEIEYRYLLDAPPAISLLCQPVEIEQFYIHRNDRSATRIRSMNNRDFFITQKEGKGLKRIEREADITSSVFDILKNLAFGEIYKTRYNYIFQDFPFLWTIDVYHERLKGLVLLEGELKNGLSHETRVEIPAGLAPYIVADITHKPEFSNLFLSVIIEDNAVEQLLAPYGIHPTK